jgi:methylenetetrahydrofolate--tRNA-(uracil-5-)-methyltransferase
VRLGQIHRNCYINAPTVLRTTLESKSRDGLFFAGQISGVEGYTESAASGLLAGINAALRYRGEEPVTLPETTMLGGLCRYIAHADPENYQPTNAAFGLLPAPAGKLRKAERKRVRSRRALDDLDAWIAACGTDATPEAVP